MEDTGWNLPISCFFVDGTGRSESFKIDPESFGDTPENTH